MVDFYKTFLLLNYGLLALIVFLIFWKFTILSQKERQYTYYIVFLFLVELVGLILAYIFELQDTSFIYQYYIAGEFLLITNIFIKKLDLPKHTLVISSIIGVIFLISANIPEINFNLDEAKVASNIVIICLAGFTLLKQVKDDNSSNRFILVDACIFFYYSVSVFIFIIQQQLQNLSEDNFYMILGINTVLSSILYSSFIYTFLKLKK